MWIRHHLGCEAGPLPGREKELLHASLADSGCPMESREEIEARLAADHRKDAAAAEARAMAKAKKAATAQGEAEGEAEEDTDEGAESDTDEENEPQSEGLVELTTACILGMDPPDQKDCEREKGNTAQATTVCLTSEIS